MRRGVCGSIISVAVAMTVLGGGVAHAENFAAPSGSFRFEVAPRTYARAPAVEGYVYNDGIYRITNVRLKIEVLDGNGAVIEEVMGWVMGDVLAGGRGYFVVQCRTRTALSYRVTVVAFDAVSRGGA